MSDMNPLLTAELGGDNPLVFLACEIILPDYNLRLIYGSGEVEMSGNTFVGNDDTYGVIIALDPPEDGMGDQAPTLTISMAAPSDTSAADLASPLMQGSRTRVWFGAIDRATGAPIPDPYLLFDGELDQPTLTTGLAKRTVDYDVVSMFDILFDNDEGARLADAFHQSIWPGELGLEFVTGIIRQIIWGPGERTSASVSTGGSSGRGGVYNQPNQVAAP